MVEGRLLIDTYLSVREAVGDDFIVGMKINCDDFTDGGFNFGESSWICERMAMMEMVFIEISEGKMLLERSHLQKKRVTLKPLLI